MSCFSKKKKQFKGRVILLFNFYYGKCPFVLVPETRIYVSFITCKICIIKTTKYAKPRNKQNKENILYFKYLLL